MTNPVFKKGKKFRFIRDNSNGGDRFGRKGEEYEVVSVYDSTDEISFAHPDYPFHPAASVKDIEPVAVEAPQESPQVPIKATFSIPRAEIEGLIRSHLETKLGIKLGAAGLVYRSSPEIAVEAEVLAA